MKKQLLLIGISILLGTLVFCEFNPAVAMASPHWEYDVTITPNCSLQLFFNQSTNGAIQRTHETISSISYDNNHNEISRTIHGITLFDFSVPCYVKNNGLSNLTNICIISGKELIEVIPVLEVNKTFSINLSVLRYSISGIDILDEQGVYAKIYSVHPEYVSSQVFDFNVFSMSFLLFALVSICFGVFFGIQYIRKKMKSYIVIILVAIVLTIIFLLLSYFCGLTQLAA